MLLGLIGVHHDIKVGGAKFEPYLHSTFHLKVKNQRLGPCLLRSLSPHMIGKVLKFK